MNARNILSLALVALLLAAPALAQQPQAPASQASTSAKAKADAKTKKGKKPYDPNDFGKLPDTAKEFGVDTNNPESLKGKNVDAELMKNFKL